MNKNDESTSRREAIKKLGYGFGAVTVSSILTNKSYAQDTANLVFHTGETYTVDGASLGAISAANVLKSDAESQGASATIGSACTTVTVTVTSDFLSHTGTSCVPTQPQNARCWWLQWLFGLCN